MNVQTIKAQVQIYINLYMTCAYAYAYTPTYTHICNTNIIQTYHIRTTAIKDKITLPKKMGFEDL